MCSANAESVAVVSRDVRKGATSPLAFSSSLQQLLLSAMSSALTTSHYSVLPEPFNIFLVNGVEGKKFYTDAITIASLHHADEWSDEPCPVSK